MAARGEDIDMDPVQAKRTHPDSTTNEKSLTNSCAPQELTKEKKNEPSWI